MSILRGLAVATLVMASTLGIAQEPSDANVGSSLPPKIRGLLIQEMNAVLGATESILGALVQGQHDVVAKNAQAIHDSFIMKQSMTDADRQALLASVTDAFLARDKAFHQLSADLAEAARAGNTQRQHALFEEMVNACTECHSQHAAQRFPGLGKPD